jgi:hypothetical protein
MKPNNDLSNEEDFSTKFDELEVRKVPPTEGSVAVQTPVQPAPSKKKGSGFLRSCLFWSVGLFGIFALGIAATWVLQVRPRSAQIEKLGVQAATAQSEVVDLEERLDLLLPLEDENASLLVETAGMNRELALLRVLLSVKTAQMALMMDDVADAQEGLENSREDLERVAQGMTGAEAKVLQDLLNRLDLIQSEIDRDPEAAAQDLEILANTLVTLERAISIR